MWEAFVAENSLSAHILLTKVNNSGPSFLLGCLNKWVDSQWPKEMFTINTTLKRNFTVPFFTILVKISLILTERQHIGLQRSYSLNSTIRNTWVNINMRTNMVITCAKINRWSIILSGSLTKGSSVETTKIHVLFLALNWFRENKYVV